MYQSGACVVWRTFNEKARGNQRVVEYAILLIQQLQSRLRVEQNLGGQGIAVNTSSSSAVSTTRLDMTPRTSSLRLSGSTPAASLALIMANYCSRCCRISAFSSCVSDLTNRPTILPGTMCERTISTVSSGLTPAYQATFRIDNHDRPVVAYAYTSTSCQQYLVAQTAGF